MTPPASTATLDGHPADAADPDVLARLLERRLGIVHGAAVTVPRPTRLTGGASRETWSFTVRHPDGSTRRLVLRRDPPGDGRPDGMAREAAVIAAAGTAGVPVPRLFDSGTDPAVLGAPYLITEHVDGETIARRLLRDERYAPAREGMAAELGRTLARIHALPADAVPVDAVPVDALPDPAGPGTRGTDPLGQLRADYDALGEPLPTIEIALQWLDRHRPAAVPETVVHGDFRTGNLIIDPSGLRAVLDWELVHRGDPREDLGWLCVKCWRFGSPLPAGGFGTVEQLLDGYAEVAGHRPDPEAVRWWQVYGTARWAVGCRAMAERHLSGETPSVELAAIGRRVCEQEHDVLLALGVPTADSADTADTEDTAAAGDAADADRDRAAPGSDLHGRPTAGDLVAAVAMFLRDDVMAATGGRTNFLARVAANALDGVGRELRCGPEQERRHRERLAAFAQDDQAGLAAAIRAGVLAADDPALLAAVRATVTDRLRVANPRYLSHPG